MKEKIKEKSGITLVSLVVTIIILIILAGITINMTIGNNGILTIAKKAKENTELARIEEETSLNELYERINSEGGTVGDLPYDTIAKIKELETTLNQTTAEATHILKDYKAYSKGKLLIGTMVNQGAQTANLNAGESYTIPEGYHNGQGVITANSLESQTVGDATAEDIQEGKTAWVNGELIVGVNAPQNIPKYHKSIGKTLGKTYNISTPSKAHLIIILAVTDPDHQSSTNQFAIYSDGTYCTSMSAARGTKISTVTDNYFVVPNMVTGAYWKAEVYYVL